LQYEEMQKDKEIAVLASNYDVVDEKGKFLYTERYAKSPEEIYYTLQFQDCLGHPTVMFRKHIIFDIFNGYDKNHESEDYDLWLKISSKYKISKINNSLLKLRTSRNSRMGAMGRKIDAAATFLAKRNLESLTGEKINLDIIEILRRNFTAFRPSSSIKFSKEEIRKAIIILENVNNETLIHHPTFLNRSVLEKIINRKCNSLEYDLYLATIFDTKFGFILKFLFKVYFFFKRRFIQKFNQLGRCLAFFNTDL